MKKIVFMLPVILFLASCKKESTQKQGPIIDPRFSRVIARDTILAGNFWEFAIGQTPEQVYSTLQASREQRQIQYLGITNNIFTNIADLETRIALYNELFLDEMPGGKADGIQISFGEGKIQTIYTNNGDRLNFWPVTSENMPFIRPGDAIAGLYNKLFSLSNISQYSPKFQQMALFSKNMERAYDPQMSLSSKWQFTSAVVGNRWWMADLNFSNGILISIHTTLSEYS